jgi:TMEM175 potassium channel family protein
VTISRICSASFPGGSAPPSAEPLCSSAEFWQGRVDEAQGDPVRNLPDRLWPRYLAYVVSFVVIARFWVTHRMAFLLIAREDAVLVWLNLLMLMFVAFLPFPTAVLGAHAGSPAATVLYATSVILASIASAAYWWYASGRGRLLRPDAGRARVRALRARGLSGPIFFALTLPIAVFAPYAAEIAWILVFPLTRLVFAWSFAEENEQPG